MRNDTTPRGRARQNLTPPRCGRYTRRSAGTAVAALLAASAFGPATARGQTGPTSSEAVPALGGPRHAAAGPRLSAPRVAGVPSLAFPTVAAPLVVRRDSATRYLDVGRVQRRESGLFAAAGVAAMAIAFGQIGDSGRMGLSGGSGAAFVVGAALGLLGGERFVASRESLARAAEWAEPTTARAP